MAGSASGRPATLLTGLLVAMVVASGCGAGLAINFEEADHHVPNSGATSFPRPPSSSRLTRRLPEIGASIREYLEVGR